VKPKPSDETTREEKEEAKEEVVEGEDCALVSSSCELAVEPRFAIVGRRRRKGRIRRRRSSFRETRTWSF
jgi:hypothetical protein